MSKMEALDAAAEATSPHPITRLEDDGFYDMEFVCKFFGGSRPLHPATIYRGIAQGRYPRPVRSSPNSNRWIGRELKAAKTEIVEAPRRPLQPPQRRCKNA